MLCNVFTMYKLGADFLHTSSDVCGKYILHVFLPPANEVWGKVICLQECVCPRGVPAPGGCLLPWRMCTACSSRMRTACSSAPPSHGHCCGRYVSYWNAFLSYLCNCFYHKSMHMYLWYICPYIYFTYTSDNIQAKVINLVFFRQEKKNRPWFWYHRVLQSCKL